MNKTKSLCHFKKIEGNDEMTFKIPLNDIEHFIKNGTVSTFLSSYH